MNAIDRLKRSFTKDDAWRSLKTVSILAFALLLVAILAASVDGGPDWANAVEEVQRVASWLLGIPMAITAAVSAVRLACAGE